MEYDIKDIKKIRMQLGLTQSELAKKSNVSQSLIAKIESNLIDPSYSNIKKIFETLDMLNSENDSTAKDLMQKQVIAVEHNCTIKSAIDKMRKSAISQLPITKDNIIIGLVTESDILDAISANSVDKNKSIVSEIMKDAPPIVSETTRTKVILGLLKFYSIIVVVDKGKFKGVITKADVLNKMY